jgi:AraC-like DNA-binding protein
VSHFHRCFRRRFGAAPAQLRANTAAKERLLIGCTTRKQTIFAGAIVQAAASSAPRFAQKCASNTVENPDPGDQHARIPRGPSKP